MYSAEDRRLIEDYLPTAAISAKLSREKSARKGHISTLHLRRARRLLLSYWGALYGVLVPANQFEPGNGPKGKRKGFGRLNAANFAERLGKYPGNRCLIGLIFLYVEAFDAMGQETNPLGANALLQNVQEVMTGVDEYVPVEEPAPKEEPLVLDMRACVELALAQHPRVLKAGEDAAAARARIGQAKSRRLPQAKLQAAYTYSEGFSQDFGGSSIINQFIGLDSFDTEWGTISGTASVEQVLYAGGQIQAAVRASKFLAESESWKKKAVYDQVEFEAKQAFYDCLLTQALIEVAQDSVTTFERHRSDAAQMLEVGLVSRFEVLRAETELGARQTDLESACSAAKIALLNLRRILGTPQDRPIELSGNIEWIPPVEPVDTLIAEAKEHRAELLALDQAIKAAEQQVRVKWGEFLPKAAANAQYVKSEGDTMFQPEGFSVTVGAQWDIYAGGRRKHEVQEAKAQRNSLEHQRADVWRLVEMDVRQAYIRVQESIAKIRKEKGTVELGREGLRLAQVRFQEGVGRQAETLDAELALTQARTTLAQALRDYAVALAALDKAVGQSILSQEAAR